MLSSCSSEKTLVLTDPGFDYFASRSMGFYNFRRDFIFRLKGFDPDFIPYSPHDSYEDQIDSLLDDSVYSSVVSGKAPLYRIDIPESVNTVLMGEFSASVPDLSGTVVSTALPALSEAGRYMKKRYLEDGLEPLIILSNSAEDGKTAVIDGWGQDEFKLGNNILEIEPGEADVSKMLESFFENYDFEDGAYLLLAYCAPVMKDVLESLPSSNNVALILEMPDDSIYPIEPDALIQIDYKGLLRAAAEMLKDGEAGGIRKVPYLFQKK